MLELLFYILWDSLNSFIFQELYTLPESQYDPITTISAPENESESETETTPQNKYQET